jgi:transcriptional regulator with XRE-family HTH domain
VSEPVTTASQDDISTAFGIVVRERRKELHMSQERLAERARIHRTYIADVERGTRNIALRNVARLATALDLSLVDLFRRVEAAAPARDGASTKDQS